MASTGPRSDKGSGREDILELFDKMLDPKVKNANERMAENYKKAFDPSKGPETFRIIRNG